MNRLLAITVGVLILSGAAFAQNVAAPTAEPPVAPPPAPATELETGLGPISTGEIPVIVTTPAPAAAQPAQEVVDEKKITPDEIAEEIAKGDDDHGAATEEVEMMVDHEGHGQ